MLRRLYRLRRDFSYPPSAGRVCLLGLSTLTWAINILTFGVDSDLLNVPQSIYLCLFYYTTIAPIY